MFQLPLPTNLTERICQILVMMGNAAFSRALTEKSLTPLVSLLLQRFSRLRERFTALVKRVAEGRPAAKPRMSRAGQLRPQSPRPDMPPPTSFGWMQRLIAGDAYLAFTRFEYQLRTCPELAALIAAEPQAAGRILRPMCHMLGIPLPDSLKLPKRPKRPKPAPSDPPKPKRTRRPRIAYPWIPIPNFALPVVTVFIDEMGRITRVPPPK